MFFLLQNALLFVLMVICWKGGNVLLSEADDLQKYPNGKYLFMASGVILYARLAHLVAVIICLVMILTLFGVIEFDRSAPQLPALSN